MARKKTYEELRAELAEANRTVAELEDENEELADRLDEIAGIAVEEEEDEDEDDEDAIG